MTCLGPPSGISLHEIVRAIPRTRSGASLSSPPSSIFTHTCTLILFCNPRPLPAATHPRASTPPLSHRYPLYTLHHPPSTLPPPSSSHLLPLRPGFDFKLDQGTEAFEVRGDIIATRALAVVAAGRDVGAEQFGSKWSRRRLGSVLGSNTAGWNTGSNVGRNVGRNDDNDEDGEEDENHSERDGGTDGTDGVFWPQNRRLAHNTTGGKSSSGTWTMEGGTEGNRRLNSFERLETVDAYYLASDWKTNILTPVRID